MSEKRQKKSFKEVWYWFWIEQNSQRQGYANLQGGNKSIFVLTTNCLTEAQKKQWWWEISPADTIEQMAKEFKTHLCALEIEGKFIKVEADEAATNTHIVKEVLEIVKGSHYVC